MRDLISLRWVIKGSSEEMPNGYPVCVFSAWLGKEILWIAWPEGIIEKNTGPRVGPWGTPIAIDALLKEMFPNHAPCNMGICQGQLFLRRNNQAKWWPAAQNITTASIFCFMLLIFFYSLKSNPINCFLFFETLLKKIKRCWYLWFLKIYFLKLKELVIFEISSGPPLLHWTRQAPLL